MKRVSLALLLVALIAQPVQAGTWTQQDLGTIQGLMSIVEIDGRYTAVGNTGNIIGSTDGDSWAVLDQNTTAYWRDTDARDNRIWTIGEGGVMRTSEDVGQTWANTTLGVTENLYDIDVSGTYGYLVGASGRIMSYNTEANLWIAQTSPTTFAMYAVQDNEDGTLWMAGEQGYLLYGYDVATSWLNKGRVTTEDIYDIWFNGDTGYVIGRNATIRKTIDNAVSWTDVTVPGLVSQSLYDMEVRGDEMIMVGDKVIAYSDDAGDSWETFDYSEENYTFRDAYFNEEGIWIVGSNDDVRSVILLFAEEEVTEVPVEEPEEEVVEETEEEPLTIVEAEEGNLIKLPCIGETDVNDPCRAVYYYATDGKRHAFPNERVFSTWFANFDDVITVSGGFMSNVPLGKNVTYHPGTKMVKFQSVPTVYAVAAQGQLRAIASEQVATDLYGSDWNQQIDDISDAFIGNYTFGEDIESSEDFNVTDHQQSVGSLDDNF